MTVSLLIVATSCIARSIKNQLNNNDRFRHLIGKYSTITMGCQGIVGDIDMCPNPTYGQLDCYLFDAIIYYLFFYANMNISNNDIRTLSEEY